MKLTLEKLQDKAEKLGWSMKIYEDYISLTTYSPQEQEHFHEISIKHQPDGEIDYMSMMDELYECVDAFDVEEETMLWVDEDGHGKNGAPYRLKDLLKDMEWCKKQSMKLYKKLNEFVIKNINK
jgi:hypothetical protein